MVFESFFLDLYFLTSDLHPLSLIFVFTKDSCSDLSFIMISICSHLHLFQETWYPKISTLFPEGIVCSALDFYGEMILRWINYDTNVSHDGISILYILTSC